MHLDYLSHTPNPPTVILSSSELLWGVYPTTVPLRHNCAGLSERFSTISPSATLNESKVFWILTCFGKMCQTRAAFIRRDGRLSIFSWKQSIYFSQFILKVRSSVSVANQLFHETQIFMYKLHHWLCRLEQVSPSSINLGMHLIVALLTDTLVRAVCHIGRAARLSHWMRNFVLFIQICRLVTTPFVMAVLRPSLSVYWLNLRSS